MMTGDAWLEELTDYHTPSSTGDQVIALLEGHERFPCPHFRSRRWITRFS